MCGERGRALTELDGLHLGLDEDISLKLQNLSVVAVDHLNGIVHDWVQEMSVDGRNQGKGD